MFTYFNCLFSQCVYVWLGYFVGRLHQHHPHHSMLAMSVCLSLCLCLYRLVFDSDGWLFLFGVYMQ